jgi:NAD+ diphosphatase
VKNYGRFMNCKTCEKDFYPRVDPVIITLLIHQDSCLLCRLPTSPKRRYSCVAGFLEPGESIEDCVRREASEEVGVNVISVKYILSDPWPTEMGSNLMIGCLSEVDSKNFTINKLELEDAKWFSKKEINTYLTKLSDEYILPEHYTTANKLLSGWLRE